MFGISSVSPLHPYMLAHVVAKVHGTVRLLVACEVCAKVVDDHYFTF